MAGNRPQSAASRGRIDTATAAAPHCSSPGAPGGAEILLLLMQMALIPADTRQRHESIIANTCTGGCAGCRSVSAQSIVATAAATTRAAAAAAASAGVVKVFANSLYDAGDILAGEPDHCHHTAAAAPRPAAPPGALGVVPLQSPPMSPLIAGASQKFQQQRVMAAQVCVGAATVVLVMVGHSRHVWVLPTC